MLLHVRFVAAVQSIRVWGKLLHWISASWCLLPAFYWTDPVIGMNPWKRQSVKRRIMPVSRDRSSALTAEWTH